MIDKTNAISFDIRDCSNKMKAKIRYYTLISASYYVDVYVWNSIYESMCNSVGYDARYSVSVNLIATNTDGNFEWTPETLLRDCIRDYFKNE